MQGGVLTTYHDAVQTASHEHEDQFPTDRHLRSAQTRVAYVRLLPGNNDLTL